jgi:hypothetical protein
MMASAGLREEIEIKKSQFRRDSGINPVIAYVTFEKEGKMEARFIFIKAY